MTGIGFLGAGVIMHGASGEVRGLTTAATMWAMTGVGLAVGSGQELLGALLALLVYIIIASGEWPVLARLRRLSSGTAADAASQRLGPASPVEARAMPGRENGPSSRKTASTATESR